MGTNLNSGRGAGGSNMSLTRQTSIYSLTFNELQNSMNGSIGKKDFGSMNMDELLKSIWTADETQPLAAGAAVTCLQRQGSLNLPMTLTHKTVDEIWKDMESASGSVSVSEVVFPQKQPTLGEITLEEFLVRAGVVMEDDNTTQNSNRVGLYADIMTADMSSGFSSFGFPQAGLMTNNSQMMQSSNLHLNVNGGRSSHQQSSAASQPPPLFPEQYKMYGELMQGNTGIGTTVASVSLAQLSSDGLGKSNGDHLSSLSDPVADMFNGGIRGRKANGTVEKVVERRQRRMIKNRESAAKSRARKQAYTMELEAEVAKLKEENHELEKKQVEIMEVQKNQVLEMVNNQGGVKRQRLRRTQTGP